MYNDKDKEHNFEDDIPPLLFSFYRALTDEGFKEPQAFTLTHTYFESIMRTMIGGQQGYVRPPEGQVEDEGDANPWQEEDDDE